MPPQDGWRQHSPCTHQGCLARAAAVHAVPGGGTNSDISPVLLRMRAWLLRLVEAMELPSNPLDQLIELLGGEKQVAELTGR